MVDQVTKMTFEQKDFKSKISKMQTLKFELTIFVVDLVIKMAC